ncbi:hypothetical protein [Sphingobium ummariense]|uniref:Uncharacterized protein n=1 Tax=Sphingobium ummariense RL-3 TaxID=1346791 RepID=T0J1A4_9SPHN|nr:hypothetical protein [Sphingobium ummariense]EQB30592.1 hypothetical protein M529_19795 [Sphingobium ummariense RL-3]
MPPSRHRDQRTTGRLPFVATLWVAILVALLCAVLPLGAPASKLTGSAFNPATTSVVLKARSPAKPLAQAPALPDGLPPTPSSLPAMVLAATMAVLLAWRLLPRSPALPRRSAPLPSAPRRIRRARAPPLR